jgi:hypothetical protein
VQRYCVSLTNDFDTRCNQNDQTYFLSFLLIRWPFLYYIQLSIDEIRSFLYDIKCNIIHAVFIVNNENQNSHKFNCILRQSSE